jgi:hypothetical protein
VNGADAGRVEGTVAILPLLALCLVQVWAFQVAAYLIPDPVAHLPGGLAREGDGQDGTQIVALGH